MKLIYGTKGLGIQHKGRRENKVLFIYLKLAAHIHGKAHNFVLVCVVICDDDQPIDIEINGAVYLGMFC